MLKTKITPKFSVIIPIHGRRQMATQAILSVLKQSNIENELVEIILCADEQNIKVSNDDRQYYTKLSKNIYYHINKNEEGPGGARQTGLALAKGEYILFLDSDDILLPGFLKEMEKFFVDRKTVAALCFSKDFFETGISFEAKTKLKLLTAIRDTFLMMSHIINNGNLYPESFYLCQFSHLLFKSKFIKKLKFDYDFRHGGEDWDFFVKSMIHGRIKIVPKRLLLFRYSPGSSTYIPLNRKKKWSAYKLVLKKIPNRFKKGLFGKLFEFYIEISEGKN